MNLRAETLVSIASALNVDVSSLFSQCESTFEENSDIEPSEAEILKSLKLDIDRIWKKYCGR